LAEITLWLSFFQRTSSPRENMMTN
jgi:hypothetical protein